MNPLARLSSHATFCLLTAAAAPLLAACGGDHGEAVVVHDRLWLTSVPHSAKDEVGAFVILRASENHQYGFLFKGSLYRGFYDTFHWTPESDSEGGKMRMVQDDKVYKIRTETCEPDAGFQYCVQIHGDPQGTVRYQSRKRWGLARPKNKLPKAADLTAQIEALAAEDPELAAVLAQMEPSEQP